MRFGHPAHPGRGVRLAYSQNVHPAASPRELLANLRAFTVPLRERLGVRGPFGVGLYFSAPVAREFEARPNGEFAELAAYLCDQALDPFTYNAFPYAGFGAAGLKAAVFDPPWSAAERVDYTARVARLAAALVAACSGAIDAGAAATGAATPSRHVSISTHTGAHSSRVDTALAAAIPRGFAAVLPELARTERKSGTRIVLALEPEPRANVNDLAALAAWRATALKPRGPLDRKLAERYLGTCLDACHAAVEFEEPARALAHAVAERAPLGKLQYTNALALREPSRHAAGRAQLFALDEPRYLHQVTARSRHGLARAGDLGEARAAFESGAPAWCDADEWRCHFHVPTDLAADAARVAAGTNGDGGLGTTRAHAEALLAAALAAPERWGTDELHLEIETYTWSILPESARGAGELVDGLEREYRHVLGLLQAHGWTP